MTTTLDVLKTMASGIHEMIERGWLEKEFTRTENSYYSWNWVSTVFRSNPGGLMELPLMSIAVTQGIQKEKDIIGVYISLEEIPGKTDLLLASATKKDLDTPSKECLFAIGNLLMHPERKDEFKTDQKTLEQLRASFRFI